jgi:hypothetical protein
MKNAFFEVIDDLDSGLQSRRVKSHSNPTRELRLPKRWFLDRITADGVRVYPKNFATGQRSKARNVKIRVQYEGHPLDITLIGMTLPVVSARAKSVIDSVSSSEMEFIPASISGHSADYYVINTLITRDCLDTKKSIFDRWTQDGPRPDLAGEIECVYRLVVDPKCVKDSMIFRITQWMMPIIVSERLKNAIEQAGLSGIKFRSV